MIEHRAHISVAVGDAEPAIPIHVLAIDLAHRLHDEIIAVLGRDTPGCGWNCYANEVHDDVEGDRELFESHLRRTNIDPTAIARHLAQWDRARRPVGIIHVVDVRPGDPRP